MCKEMDQIYREGERVGEQRGLEEGKKQMVAALAEMGMAIEKIAEAARVSVTIVQEWLAADMDTAQ